MRLTKLHRVLVVGGAALTASCSDAPSQQKQTFNAVSDAAPDGVRDERDASSAMDAPPSDGAPPDAFDAAVEAAAEDASGVDAWLTWV